MDYFRPVLGGTLVDASCGTGLFTRKFARSGQWKGVVALDFSESMLQQAQTYFKEDAGLTNRWGGSGSAICRAACSQRGGGLLVTFKCASAPVVADVRCDSMCLLPTGQLLA
jgi:SAM-dependent methyltransferase